MVVGFIIIALSALKISSALTVTEPIFELHFNSKYDSNHGLGWPDRVDVAAGHDALLRLTKPVINMESCTIKSPKGYIVDLNNLSQSRFEKWGRDRCGVRIKNISYADEGLWKMTATRGNFSISGFSEVKVVNPSITDAKETIHLHDGKQNAKVVLTTTDNLYCVVSQPFTERSIVPGHCTVSLEKITRAVQGKWDVGLGLLGQVAEMDIGKQVLVDAERLDVGYSHDFDNNKLHMHCNILNSDKEISFCRFQRTTKILGYHLVDGISNGDYSYYGDGFHQKHCGMTLEHPTADDYGSWRCTVGVTELEGSTKVEKRPLEALVNVRMPSARTGRAIVKEHIEPLEEIQSILVENEKELKLSCRADMSLSYCWFASPNGDSFTSVDKSDDSQDYWYFGDGLSVGDCGMVIKSANHNHTGLWTCHMGPSEQLGLEITDKINIRITGPLAAVKQQIEVKLGEQATLDCQTANEYRSLSYCRFMTPEGIGINLDQSVTVDHAILGQYYYTPGKIMDYGACSLTIKSVEQHDFGVWTCAALVSGEASESRDVITVTMHVGGKDNGPLRAGIIGMSVSVVILAVVLAGFVWNKKGRPMPFANMPTPWRRETNANSEITMVDMTRDSRMGSVSSRSSDNSSGSEVTIKFGSK